MKYISLIIAFIFVFNTLYITGNANNIIVVNGGSIQDAINAASDGDIIYIMEGKYHERVIVNRSVTIIGKGKVIIDGYGSTAMDIKKSGVTLENLALTNSSDAIIKTEEKNVRIRECEIYGGRYGIVSSYAIIEECIFHECGRGVLLYRGNLVYNSTFKKCGLGMEIRGKENVVDGCNIHTCGVGIYMENSESNLITSCWVHKNNNNEGDIFLLNSSKNSIMDCNISYGSFGIRLVESNENTIKNNNIYRSRYGIKMEKCSGNKVEGCKIDSNRFGITVERCRNIKIQYNWIVGSHMYSMDARYSMVDARYNWWGSLIPHKLHFIFSRVKIFPWYIYSPHFKGSEKSDDLKGNREREVVPASSSRNEKIVCNDFDPLVDIKIGFRIKRMRGMWGSGEHSLNVYIDGKGNGTTFEGDSSPFITFWQNVDDSEQKISIIIDVDDENAFLTYDISRGEWCGDDYLKDGDGYGHLKFKNAEIWFDVIYNDYDNDGLTYWEEVHVYGTDPTKSDYGKDYDNDGIPIEWEDKYGYNPFEPENHSMDYDNDGLNDYEEYYMEGMLADPFAKDIFIEVDYMPGYEMYEESIQMLYDAFARHSITMHIDVDEKLPYMERVYYGDAVDFYWDYFLHEDVNNPRHGIFHYLILVSYGSSKRGGHVFVGMDNCDSILLACQYINDWRVGDARKVAYASLFMHELGHSLGIFDDTFGGVDNESCNNPWHKGYWIYANYKSCMNYRYAFQQLDYSDGNHGRNDFDDWDNIDLAFFKDSYYYP